MSNNIVSIRLVTETGGTFRAAFIGKPYAR